MLKKEENRGGKILTVVLTLFILAILIFGTVMLCEYVIESFHYAEEYRRVCDNPIEADAVVYKHEEYDDDGDTYYRSFVKYEVSGKEYTSKYEDEGRSGDLSPVGEVVSIKVSPENPGHILSNLKSDANILIFSGLIILTIVSIIYHFAVSSKLSKEQRAHLDSTAVRRDLLHTVTAKIKNILWLLYALFGAVLVWRYPMLFFTKTLIFTAVCAVIWIICIANTINCCKRINNNEYRMSLDKLINKRIVSSDDSDAYVLTYKSDTNNTWKVSVSRERYNREEEGNTAYAVYLNGKKKPILHYDKDGKVGK